MHVGDTIIGIKGRVGFEAAAPAISQYIGGKKGYKKNKYKYDDRTVRLVEENWKFALDQWGYSI